MKVPGTKDEYISECSFCQNLTEIKRKTGKCGLYPQGIPWSVLSKSFPGNQDYADGYCENQRPIDPIRLRRSAGEKL